MKALKIFFVILFLICTTSIIAAPKKKVALDGDTVWKQQCSRCHLAPGAVSKNKMAVVVRHMRDVAQLTDEEYKAVLAFVKGENHEDKKNR